MRFHLIYRGNDFTGPDKLFVFFSIKVRNPDGTDFSVPQSFFEGFIHFRSAFIGLVDQEKIDIIGLQLVQRLFNPRFCFLIGRSGTVNFGCEKEFFSGNSTFFDCTSDNILIFLHLGCIDQPVTKIQRSQDALFSRFPADIPGAKADHGHPNVII